RMPEKDADSQKEETKSLKVRVFIIFFMIFSRFAFSQNTSDQSTGLTEAQIAIHRLDQDIRVAKILNDLQSSAPGGPLVFRNVRLVDPDTEKVMPDQAVVIADDPVNSIVWVDDVDKLPKLPQATVIDGAGKFLSPGLVDMHIHSAGANGWLLNLANGVTT